MNKTTNEIFSSIKCTRCKRGLFLYNNTCVSKCPQDYRADRMTWTCLHNPIFAWYWVYPSKSSCNKICERNNTEVNDKIISNKTELNNNATGGNSTTLKEKNTLQNNNNTNTVNTPNTSNRTDITNIIAQSDCSCDIECQQTGTCCHDFEQFCLTNF